LEDYEEMKIIVCLKQIRHTYARTGMDPAHHFLAPEDDVYRVNPYDEAAVELALGVKDNREDTEIVLLTLGPLIADEALRRCLAMGADHLFRIDTKSSMDPWEKSLALSQTIKDLEPDLILCGKESLDTQNGQIGALVAHHLDLPFVSAITGIETLQNNTRATVKRSCGRGVREEIECKLPALFSVDMGGIEPRLPTYEARRTAGAYAVQTRVYAISDTRRARPKVSSQKIYAPRPRPKKVPAPDSRQAAFHRIRQLLAGSRIEKKGELLAGTTESQVDGIVSFLLENGFVKSQQEEQKE
jgi:electron transfer flavoprotein beta subunit